MKHGPIERAAKRFRAAQQTVEDRREELLAAIEAAIAAGDITELEAARLAGIGRQTLRRWRGQTY